jgi:hypothetical protein
MNDFVEAFVNYVGVPFLMTMAYGCMVGAALEIGSNLWRLA